MTYLKRHRSDHAQGPIVQALKQAGRPVAITSQLGDDFPDLLTRHVNGQLVMLEVKTGKGKVSEGQTDFARIWPVVVVRTDTEALLAVGVYTTEMVRR